MKELLKAALLFLYGIATIMTCSALWSTRPSATITIVSVGLFLANGYAIFRKVQAMSKDEEGKE